MWSKVTPTCIQRVPNENSAWSEFASNEIKVVALCSEMNLKWVQCKKRDQSECIVSFRLFQPSYCTNCVHEWGVGPKSNWARCRYMSVSICSYVNVNTYIYIYKYTCVHIIYMYTLGIGLSFGCLLAQGMVTRFTEKAVEGVFCTYLKDWPHDTSIRGNRKSNKQQLLFKTNLTCCVCVVQYLWL